MQSSTAQHDNLYIPLGERRGKSDLARFSIDLSWARAVSDSAHSRAYPSPPMSGSPPLPPRRNFESSDRGHGSYGSGGQDVFRGMQTPQIEQSEQRGAPMHNYPPNTGPPALYSGAYRGENMPPPQQHYQQLPQIPSQQQSHLGYVPLPPQPQSSIAFSTSDRPPNRDGPDFSSPKQQRKTKGHVASACVPCKKAHLRCDAQRPCSRCLSNGKEDTCIDVQHKKRGRPRLRDEREARYEGMASGYPQSHHEAAMRRPISQFSPSEVLSYPEPARSNSYRVLKSHNPPMMGGPITPRYLDHASAADANIYGHPMPLTPRMVPAQEPACAYLTMEMQIAKATSSFNETIGLQPMFSRKLQDIVSPADREKVARLQRGFEEERREREPNYLPPIYLAKLEEERVIQSVGFSPDELVQAHTDRQEMLTFQAPGGQQRTFQLRLGLAKKESTYFIVAWLHIPLPPQTFQQPLSSPFTRETHSRDSQYGYHNPQQGFVQNPGMSPFGANPSFGDPRGEMTAFRTPGPLGPSIPSSTVVPQYAPLQARPEFAQAQAPYQTPRSEMQPQPQRQDNLQLPPIRDPSSAMESTRRRDDRSGRVDIGGLLEKPELNRRKG